MSTDGQRVGFLGMGLMGSRMALTLARKGFQVTVWNRTRARAEAVAVQAGSEGSSIRVVDSPSQLAAGVDVVCSCVADPQALRDVYAGPSGALAGARAGQLFVDFSTVAPEDTLALDEACRARGVDFVESPVTGSRAGAERGTLVLMVGASPAALARAQPLLSAVGERAVHCGPVGAGSQVKLAGNALLALMLEGLSEAMLVTQRAGIDPRVFLEVVQASGYRSPYFDFKGKALLARDWDTHFAVDLMFKDLSLFQASAARLRVPTPAVGAVREVYGLARAQGQGDKDITAVVTALEGTGPGIGQGGGPA
jgi:3-hydroxyisobutyrate dehydrogenase